METKFAFAKDLIRQAGHYLKSRMSEDLMIEEKSAHDDLVTHLDQAVQAFLITAIKANYPEDFILAEENQVYHPVSQGSVWVIDPIDGTVNFITQGDDFAIMLAYFEEGLGQFGLIYDVMADQLYSGGPAFLPTCNDKVLPVYQSRPLKSQLVISNASMYAANDRGIGDLVRQTLGNRTYGSAGISMARVLSGKAVAYFSYIYPWDYAAADIIGQALGYQLLTLEGREPDYQTRQKIMFVPKEELELVKAYVK